MTSHRKRKKQATALGLTPRELQLVEIVEEVLEAMRWAQILGYSNQFLLEQELELTKERRDRVLEAATRAVDSDAKLHEWQRRLAALKGEVQRLRGDVAGESVDGAGSGGAAADREAAGES